MTTTSPSLSPGLSPHASPMLIPISPGLRYPYYQSLASTLSPNTKSPGTSRILPSTSAISLLSLSLDELNHHTDDDLTFEFSKESFDNSNTSAPASRRNSLQQHYNQRRHQHYRATTPSRPHSKAASVASPPDSPGLDPISLCGSPTVLFLSSSFDKATQGEHAMSLAGALAGSSGGVKKRKKSRPSLLTVPKASGRYSAHAVPDVHEEEEEDGAVPDSPDLQPVKSPKFDAPMTPLVLESESWLDAQPVEMNK
ncbi:hypothetical protein CJU89_3893 [Yarrowia sp. B02]|nr:hypothetical protein CJU89_3893 [Yarrowia sp. B02]